MYKDDLQSHWAAVLITVVRDLISPSPTMRRAREDAEIWIGNYPSKDFQHVVSLAGHDPDTLWPWFRDFIALPVEERKEQAGLRTQGPN